MNPFVDCLLAHGLDDLGTWVLVGAGEGGILEELPKFQVQKLCLIEGDDEAFGALAVRCQGLDAVYPIHRVLAADDTEVPWFQCSWRALNGPLDPSALQRYYPRLAVLGQRNVKAGALRTFLQGLALPPTKEAPNVLAFDVPGQEMALLRSLPAEMLRSFDWILTRSCSQQMAPQACLPQEVADWAAEHHFVLQVSSADGAADTLWPVQVWRLDAQAAELQALRTAMSDAQTQGQAQRVAEQALRTEMQALQTERLSLQEALAQAAHTHQRLTEELRARHEGERHRWTAELEAVRQDLGNQRGLLQQRLADALEKLAEATTDAEQAAEMGDALVLERNDLVLQLDAAKAEAHAQQLALSDASEALLEARRNHALVLSAREAQWAAQWQSAQAELAKQARLLQDHVGEKALLLEQIQQAASALERTRAEQERLAAESAQNTAAIQGLGLAATQAQDQRKAALDQLAHTCAERDAAAADARDLREALEAHQKVAAEATLKAQQLQEDLDGWRTKVQTLAPKLDQTLLALQATEAALNDALHHKERLAEDLAKAHTLHKDALTQMEQQLAGQMAQTQKEAAESLRLAQDRASATHQATQLKLAEAMAKVEDQAIEAARQRDARAELHKQVQALQAEVDALRAARDQQAASVDEKSKWARALETERNSLKQQLESQAKSFMDDLRAASRSQALATKMQVLREADLTDLQRRYQEIQTQQQAQRELLGKLAQRLSQAHRYFQQLQSEGHVPATELPHDSAADADTSAEPATRGLHAIDLNEAKAHR